MHVDGPGVDAGVGGRPIDRAEHASGRPLDNAHGLARSTQRHVVSGSFGSRPEPPARPPAQHSPCHENVEQADHGRPEHLCVGLGEGQLGGGGGQMRREDVGVLWIEDRSLHRTVEQRRGVVDQVGVQRVVAGDQYCQ